MVAPFSGGGVMTIKAVVHKAEEGGYWAEVPALPGCVTQGETMGRDSRKPSRSDRGVAGSGRAGIDLEHG